MSPIRAGATLVGFLLLLGGCDAVRAVLPRHGTTATEARAAMLRCGIVPDGVAWSVSPQGTFAFGRKSADAPPMPEAQSRCIMHWTDENRIKVALLGWEEGPRQGHGGATTEEGQATAVPALPTR